MVYSSEIYLRKIWNVRKFYAEKKREKEKLSDDSDLEMWCISASGASSSMMMTCDDVIPRNNEPGWLFNVHTWTMDHRTVKEVFGRKKRIGNFTVLILITSTYNLIVK